MTESKSLIGYLRESSRETLPPLDFNKVAQSAALRRKRRRIPMMIGGCVLIGFLFTYFFHAHERVAHNSNASASSELKHTPAVPRPDQPQAPSSKKIVASDVPASAPFPTANVGTSSPVTIGTKPPSAQRPIDHVAGAVLNIGACPAGADDDCLKKWQSATFRDRLAIAESRIVAAATKTERGAARARMLLDDRLISQLFAHYQWEPDGRVTASSRPSSSSMDVPLGFLRHQAEGTRALAIHQYSAQVFAATTETLLGRTEHFVVNMDNPLVGMHWSKVNAFIVDSSTASVENAPTQNLSAGYAVTLTLRSDRDLVLDIPQGAILVGGSGYQPLVVTAVDLVKRENFTNEYHVATRHGLLSWQVGFPAGQAKSIRLEGHCLIQSLEPPNGARYRFSGWKLRPSVLKELEANSERQEFIWDTVNAMLNVIAD